MALIEHLLSKDPADQLERLLAGTGHSFDLTVVSNASGEGSPTRHVSIRRSPAGTSETNVIATEMAWPGDTFSLSHIALPFSREDPLYGDGNGGRVPTLGNRALRGERSTLVISPGEMLRQRWNPFHGWLKQRCLEFTGLSRPADSD